MITQIQVPHSDRSQTPTQQRSNSNYSVTTLIKVDDFETEWKSMKEEQEKKPGYEEPVFTKTSIEKASSKAFADIKKLSKMKKPKERKEKTPREPKPKTPKAPGEKKPQAEIGLKLAELDLRITAVQFNRGFL